MAHLLYDILLFCLPKIASFEKVLVVDDDPDILYLVKYVLKNAGFDVCTYSTGLGVPEQVAACSPDVILLDIMLPGRMGTEICKDLRKEFSIPIIFFFCPC